MDVGITEYITGEYMSFIVNEDLEVSSTWKSTREGDKPSLITLSKGDEVTIDPEAPEEAHGRVYITKAGKHCWLYDNEVTP